MCLRQQVEGEEGGALMDQQSFVDQSIRPVLFEDSSSSVLFEAGAMDDSFDASNSDDPFAESSSTAVDVYTDDTDVPTIEVMYDGRPVGTGLPRSFASSMLERCDDVDDGSSMMGAFRRDEERPLTAEAAVLENSSMQRSQFYATEQSMQPQFASVQVALSILLLLAIIGRSEFPVMLFIW